MARRVRAMTRRASNPARAWQEENGSLHEVPAVRYLGPRSWKPCADRQDSGSTTAHGRLPSLGLRRSGSARPDR